PTRRRNSMLLRRTGTAISAVLLTALAVLVSPEAAHADPAGYEVLGVENVTVAPGLAASASVRCTDGKRPLGGGVAAFDSAVGGVKSFPVGAPASPVGWAATVANPGPVASTFGVYVICANPLAGYEVQTVTNTPVAGGQAASAWVSCTNGKKPLGGGVL